MRGRKVTQEFLDDFKRENNISGIIKRKEPTENVPLMANGYNESGIFKTKEVKSATIVSKE